MTEIFNFKVVQIKKINLPVLERRFEVKYLIFSICIYYVNLKTSFRLKFFYDVFEKI